MKLLTCRCNNNGIRHEKLEASELGSCHTKPLGILSESISSCVSTLSKGRICYRVSWYSVSMSGVHTWNWCSSDEASKHKGNKDDRLEHDRRKSGRWRRKEKKGWGVVWRRHDTLLSYMNLWLHLESQKPAHNYGYG